MILTVIPFLPLAVYLIDAKKEKNLKRGIRQIAAFLVVGSLNIVLLSFFKMLYVYLVPLLFIFYIGFISSKSIWYVIYWSLSVFNYFSCLIDFYWYSCWNNCLPSQKKIKNASRNFSLKNLKAFRNTNENTSLVLYQLDCLKWLATFQFCKINSTS